MGTEYSQPCRQQHSRDHTECKSTQPSHRMYAFFGSLYTSSSSQRPDGQDPTSFGYIF